MTRGVEHGINRRRLLALPVVPVIAACAPKDTGVVETPEVVNAQLISTLKKDLGITSRKDRIQIGRDLAKTASADKNWMVGRRITYTSEQGKEFSYSLNPQGEPNPLIAQTYDVEYPDLRREGVPIGVDRHQFADNRYVCVYGSGETLNRFGKYRKGMELFVKEYFPLQGIPSVFHLLFIPNASDIELVDIGNLSKVSLRSGATSWFLADTAGNAKRLDVVCSAFFTHLDALNKGTTLETTWRGILSNEEMHFLIRGAFSPEKRGEDFSESFSTLAQTLSELDENTANLLLGGTGYKPFVRDVSEEMRRIGKEKPR